MLFLSYAGFDGMVFLCGIPLRSQGSRLNNTTLNLKSSTLIPDPFACHCLTCHGPAAVSRVLEPVGPVPADFRCSSWQSDGQSLNGWSWLQEVLLDQSGEVLRRMQACMAQVFIGGCIRINWNSTTQAVPESIYWHATSLQVVPAIRKEGLRPSHCGAMCRIPALYTSPIFQTCMRSYAVHNVFRAFHVKLFCISQ